MCGRLGWAIDDQKRYGTSWDITWPVHVHIWKVYFLTIKSRWMMGSKCRSAVIDVGGCRHMCGRLGWAIDDQKRYGTSWDITWPVHVHIWKVYFLTIKSRWMMGSKCRSAVIDVGGCRPYVWTTWMSYWWSETVWCIMRYHLAGTCPYMKSSIFWP